ncbi:MAG: bile acid:sodium symporter family protein [Bacteroidetes bacterium]|nr:MAG: bile acid:sodium symporter family protein [Bacteroidota bacterium]
MLEALLQIDEVRLNFSDNNKFLLNLTIAFIMFGVALEMRPSDFKRLVRQPQPVVVGILSQFLLMPLLTFLLAISLKDYITPTVGLGMILVAACPGGNISNFISALARGNIALSVSLTAFSSIAGLVMTPFNFAFWGNLFMQVYSRKAPPGLVRPLEIDPFDVLTTIFIILGIPLVLGLLCTFKLPKLSRLLLVPIKRFSILAFAAMVVIIFVKNYDFFLLYIKYIFLIVLVHNILALSGGYYLAKLAKLPHQERKTISIETGIQNSGLALALLFNPRIFPEDLAVGGMAFIAAWWGVWHIIAGMSIAGVWSGFSLQLKNSSQ